MYFQRCLHWSLGPVHESKGIPNVEKNFDFEDKRNNSGSDKTSITFPAAKDCLVDLDEDFFPPLSYLSSEAQSISSFEGKVDGYFINNGMHISSLQYELVLSNLIYCK